MIDSPEHSRLGKPAEPPVVEVRDLKVDFWVNGDWYPAVRGASFDLVAGEAMAIVGESGSGKSTIALAMMGLLPKNAFVHGSIRLGDDWRSSASTRARCARCAAASCR